MKAAQVELIGNFEPAEADFLEASFDHCRIELLARSQLDSSVALLRWTPAPPRDANGVTDRHRVPRAAYYVLSTNRDLALTPISSAGELEEKFPGHFPPGLVAQRAVRRGCLPGLFGMALRTFG